MPINVNCVGKTMAYKESSTRGITWRITDSARDAENCEMCGERATGPTNLKKHTHQEVVFPDMVGALGTTYELSA